MFFATVADEFTLIFLSMDRETEQFVLQLLQKIKKDAAVIFITHRLHVLKSFLRQGLYFGKWGYYIAGKSPSFIALE